MQLNNEDVRFFDVLNVLDTSTNSKRTFIAVIPADFLLRLYEEVNGQLVLVTQLPGTKQGAVRLDCRIGSIQVYYTSRPVGKTTGPFYLMVEEVPVANVYPMNEVATARLTEVVKRISMHLSNLVNVLGPFKT